MPILVDYRCCVCHRPEERWVDSPPPAETGCAVCGGAMRRKWVPVGLRHGASEPRGDVAPDDDPPEAPKPSLCSRYPRIPGLCHMSESAGRAWVARYLRDNRALEREQQRQEQSANLRAPTLDDAITTHHYPTKESTPCHPTSSTRRS